MRCPLPKTTPDYQETQFWEYAVYDMGQYPVDIFMWLFCLQKEQEEMIREITFDQDPPPLEWHIARTPDEFDLLSVS